MSNEAVREALEKWRDAFNVMFPEPGPLQQELLEITRAALVAPTPSHESVIAAAYETCHNDHRKGKAQPPCVACITAALSSEPPGEGEDASRISQAPIGSLRPEVIAFAHHMEAKLRENDHKGGWRNDLPSVLMERLHQEAEELNAALDGGKDCACREACCGHWATVKPVNVLQEAADVANFAMMIADLFVPLAALGALSSYSDQPVPEKNESIDPDQSGPLISASAPPVDGVREALEGLMVIVRESHGVTGWHRNDDVATWDEFEEPQIAEDALAASHPKGAASRGEDRASRCDGNVHSVPCPHFPEEPTL